MRLNIKHLLQLKSWQNNTPTEKGFTLIIAVLLTFLFTSITAAISTFAFRELRLTGSGAQSLLAFYAADTALECVLDADLNDNVFFDEVSSGVPDDITISDCANGSATMQYSNSSQVCGDDAEWCYQTSSPFTFGFGESNYQAEVFYTLLNNGGDGEVLLRAEGRYGRSTSRTVERGLEYRYLQPD